VAPGSALASRTPVRFLDSQLGHEAVIAFFDFLKDIVKQ